MRISKSTGTQKVRDYAELKTGYSEMHSGLRNVPHALHQMSQEINGGHKSGDAFPGTNRNATVLCEGKAEVKGGHVPRS